ncbi:phage tail tape measure protein [Mucilaginibacter sp.]|uniref:phage tail tape measure protein n=1 Tax=Mucilaginibacter sp. TaxID=1882438 RepID=UPI0035BBDB9D
MASKEEVRRVSVYINGSEADLTLKQLEAGSKKLKNELAQLVPGTDAFKKKLEELAQTKNILTEIDKDIRGIGGAWGWLKTEVGKLGVLATGYMGFEFVTDQFKNIISQNAKFSDSIADIQKTTGMSEISVRQLQKGFKDIDTRSTRAELNGLAEVAGKLGISGQQEVLGFVRAADQINVALGKDLGNAEQAINDLGKLTDIFKIKDAYGLEDALKKTGSAINDLGAIGTANEGYIVEFTKRLGGVAPAANISIQDVMGLAATFDELGQPVEAAATSIGQFITGMGQDIPRFAKIAGMSVEKFAEVLRTNGNEALIAVLKNLKSTGQGVQGLATSMGMIGEDGARATAALGLLSNNTELLEKRQQLANKSFDQGISLTNEYNIKNNNFAATLEKLGKKFNALTSNTTVTDFLVSATEKAGGFVDWLNESAKALGTIIKLGTAAAIGYAAYSAVLVIATVTQRAYWMALLESEAATNLVAAAQTAWTFVTVACTRGLKAAKSEMAALNVTMEANPIGIVVAAITALVAALYIFGDTVDETTRIQNSLTEVQGQAEKSILKEKLAIETAQKTLKDRNATKQQEADAIKSLRDLMPDHLKGYTDEEIKAGKATAAVNKHVEALLRQARATAAQNRIESLSGDIIDLQTKTHIGYDKQSLWDKVKFRAQHPFLSEEERKAAFFKDLLDQKESKQKEMDALAPMILAGSADPKINRDTAAAFKFNLQDATKDELDTQLAKDSKALDQLKRGTADYNKVAAEMYAIRKRLKEIAKDTGVGTGSGHHADPAKALLDQSKAMSQMVDEFNADALAKLHNKNEKEVLDTENSYQERINKLKSFLEKNAGTEYQSSLQRAKHLDEIKALEIARDNAVKEIRIRQEKELIGKIRDLRRGLGDVYQTELDKETERINNFYDDLLDSGYEFDSVEEARAKDLADAKIREEKRLAEEVKQIDNDGLVAGKDGHKKRLAQINKKYDEEIAALRLKFSKELQATQEFQNAVKKINGQRDAETKKENNEDKWDKVHKAADIAQSVSNAVFEIGRNSRQAETDHELNELEKRKDKELSNKNLTEEQKTAINLKYQKQEAAIKLKAWEADKQASMQQAIINGALAVVKALPNPFAAIAAGVAAAAQIAVISATKAPEFEQGGYSAIDYKQPKGYVKQPTLFKSSASGRPFSAGEKFKTEYIISSEQLKDPVVADFARMLDSGRKVRQFEYGGYSGTATGAAPSFNNSSSTGIDSNPRLDKMERLLLGFMEAQAEENAKPVNININRRVWDAEAKRTADLKRQANAG